MEVYVKDTMTGRVHKLGTDRHDSLYVNGDGHIDYLNLQICEGTGFGAFVFCDENGKDLREWEEDYNYIGIGQNLRSYEEGRADAIDKIIEYYKPCDDCGACLEEDRDYFEKKCEMDIQLSYTELVEDLEKLKE